MTKISKIKVQGVTHEIKDNEAYVKPASGIPASDIASGVIPDVSSFITKSVDDLVNYYTKSQTYTQTQVDNLIGAIDQFHYEIAASTSAVVSPQSNVLYLIGPTGSGADKYEEYVYPNSTTGWTKIGDTTIDLSGYVTTSALNTALANYTTTTDLTNLLANKVDKVNGKGLSTEDYTTAEKTKLSGIASGAEENVIETVKVNGSALTPDANKAVNIDISGKQDVISDLSTIRSGATAGATAYQKPSDGIPKTDLASSIQTSLDKADASTTQAALDAVTAKIPSAASAQNQLADKEYINSRIATSSGDFLGTSATGLTESQFLTWANTLNPSATDYVYWNTVDSQDRVVFKRYKYNGTTWLFEWENSRDAFILITEQDYADLVEDDLVNPSVIYMLYDPESEE